MKWIGTIAALGAISGMALTGCSSGESGVLDNGSGAPLPAGQFLPAVNTVDSGVIELTDGLYNGGGDNLIFTEPFSTSRIRITDQSVFSGDDQIFDRDGDGDYDYIIMTLRALSGQAEASVNASGPGGVGVEPTRFYKIAGITVLPASATSSVAVEVTLPVHSAGAPTSGKTYPLYRWESNYAGPDGPTAARPGRWIFVSNVTVDSTGNTVTFPVTRMGQYTVATNTITAATP